MNDTWELKSAAPLGFGARVTPKGMILLTDGTRMNRVEALAFASWLQKTCGQEQEK